MGHREYPNGFPTNHEREIERKSLQIAPSLSGGANPVDFRMIAQMSDCPLQFNAESFP